MKTVSFSLSLYFCLSLQVRLGIERVFLLFSLFLLGSMCSISLIYWHCRMRERKRLAIAPNGTDSRMLEFSSQPEILESFFSSFHFVWMRVNQARMRERERVEENSRANSNQMGFDALQKESKNEEEEKKHRKPLWKFESVMESERVRVGIKLRKIQNTVPEIDQTINDRTPRWMEPFSLWPILGNSFWFCLLSFTDGLAFPLSHSGFYNIL